MFKMVRRTFLKLLAVVTAALARLVYLTSSGMRGRTVADSSAQAARRIELSAIAVTVGEVELTWKSSLPDGSVSRYAIQRHGTLLATVEGTLNIYSDTNVTPGKRFIYTVIAYDAAGVALAASPPARAVTPDLATHDIWPPAPPEDLTATAFPGYILLDWFYGNDDTDITCYLIQRNGQRLARVDSGTLEFRDTTVRPSSAYVYTVQAIDTMGNRSTITSVRVRSSALTVTTEGEPSEPSEPTQFPAPYAVYLPIVSNTPSGDIPTEDTPTMSTMVYSSRLRRYPYLTDLVGPYVTINWATDTSSTTGFVTYGLVGSELPTAHTIPATRSSISINGVSEYQWKAILTLTPDTQYAYRIFLDSSTPTDLLGSDPSPTFWTQIPGGSSKPFSFIVIGDWGDASNGAAEQASLMPLIAQSGALFGFTTGDNAYSSGSQTNYGDLVETGSSVSGVFGPQGWTIPGRSLPLFPVLGNHGISNSDSAGNSHLLNWPQGMAAQLSNGRYVSEFYGGIDGTTPRNYPSTWFAFDAGIARFYVLKAAWGDTNTGNASSVYQVDYDYHWTPSSAEYQWLANDLATHPSTLKFAFFHYPLYSDNASQESDTYLQGPNSLEGLLINNGVNLAFYGHAHYYQRNVANGLTSYLVGASGVKLQRMDGGCSSVDAYALGWSNSNNQGYACGSAPVPTSKSQVYHFLKVSVNGATVTVTPMNALGQTFDVQVFNFGSGATPTPTPTPTATNTPTPAPPTPTDTPTPTGVPPTSTNTPEPTLTATPTTASPTPTDTPTPVPTLPSTPTDTPTPTSVPPTSTNTPEPTLTATPTTAPPTPTSVPPTSTNTPEPTATPTNTPTPTSTSTSTPTPTQTQTPTPTPGGSTTLVAQGSVWRYLDNGSNQGTVWRDLAFNDSTWASGPAPLGYGDPMATTINSGPSSNRFITTYFRTSFNVPNPGLYSALTLLLRRDDGAVVYLNGLEVVRSNMPTGTVTYQTLAASTVDGANETTFYTYTIPASALVAGNNTLAVEVHQRSASSTDLGFDLRLDAGSSSGTPTPAPTATSTGVPATSTPAPTATSTPTPGSGSVLVARGNAWRYLDNGSDQGAAWRSPTFDDAAWASGPAPLGYGSLSLNIATIVNSGPSANRYITTYFRRTFGVANPGQYSTLTLQLRRDDGAVVYLNGVEVARSNMPAGSVTYQTLAATTVSGANEMAFFTYAIPVSALVAGNNTLAVEIHQRAASSSDIVFDLELAAA